MRTLRKLVIASALALVIGASVGFIRDDAEAIVTDHTTHPASLLRQKADETRVRDEEFAAREIDCLGNIVFREMGNQSVGVRRLAAIVTIARRDDPDPQWPKTICGIMKQRGQISQVDRLIHLDRGGLLALLQDREIAAEVYEGAWKTQKLPHGWECVRYWRISDGALAKLNEKKFAQLGIDKKLNGLSFFDKLVAVKTPPGSVTFFRDPNRCMRKLPTT
jgi:hypothetical protein